MKTAIISLPKYEIYTNSVLNNLNGYWNPPACVLSFWATACTVEYTTEEQYFIDSELIKNSYDECVNQFYRENVL